MGRFTYMVSKTSAGDRRYLVLQYFFLGGGGGLYLAIRIGYERFIWNISRLYSGHKPFFFVFCFFFGGGGGAVQNPSWILALEWDLNC